MKTLIRSWIVLGIVLGLAMGTRASGAEEKVAAEVKADAGEAASVRYVVGLSPFLGREVKDDVYRRLVGFLLEDVPLGSSLWIYDAFHLRTIAQVDVPNVRAFRSSKTRANQYKDAVQKLREFLAAPPEKPAESKVPLDNAVRLPQFLDFTGANLASPGRALVVIVLGSPLYVDPKEPSFSMIDGYFPSDGHLRATRDQSVFGLKARAGALKDIAVHFGYFGDPWVTAVHEEKVARFWSLYMQEQGGRLATFCGDVPTVFNAVRAGPAAAAPPATRHQIDAAQTKIEMLRITRDAGASDWITRDVLPGAPRDPPSRLTGPMKIGIRWRGQVDLDLYAAARPDAETLFFEHTRAPEGYYFKDHRSSPEREYEFIEFEVPIDVRQAEARINFYEGDWAGGPNGEVRIEFDGKIYSGRFTLPATSGNQGRTGGGQDGYWAEIDIPTILNLRGRALSQQR